MIIYRIQSLENEGPYTHLAKHKLFNYQPHHIFPDEDEKLLKEINKNGYVFKRHEVDVPENIVCGFIHAKQLIDWFLETPQHLKSLCWHDVGMITLYECDDVWVGDTQVMFNVDKAVIVKEIFLEDYYYEELIELLNNEIKIDKKEEYTEVVENDINGTGYNLSVRHGN